MIGACGGLHDEAPIPQQALQRNRLIASPRMSGAHEHDIKHEGRDEPGLQTFGQTFTSGTFGTEPRGGGGPPSPRGPGGLLRRCAPGRRFGRVRIGIFSAFGVTGPSGNSKPSLLSPDSSLTSMTRTWPPALSLP